MSRRTWAAAAGLLAIMTVVTLMVLPAPPAQAPGCDAQSVFTLNPIGVDFAGTAVRLEAYGRSAGVLAPGETLCLGLSWQVTIAQPALDGIRIDLRRGETIAATTMDALALTQGESTTIHPLRVGPRVEAGTYTLRVTPLNGSQPIGAGVDISTLPITH